MGSSTESATTTGLYLKPPGGKSFSKKKLYWYSRFGTIEILEQSYTTGKRGALVRPFSQQSQVQCRSYSLPLQRVITDFGADVPFGQIPQKLQEHHGITVPISSAQAITLHHADAVLQSEQLKSEIPMLGKSSCLIVEMDGSYIPMVTTAPPQESEEPPQDRRKTRTLGWMEARLVLCRPADQEKLRLGATLGTPDQAGDQLLDCAIRSGLGQQTYVHGVGDGALWIAMQVSDCFGEPGGYLIDFFHLSEYLGAASMTCSPEDASAWLDQQKQRCKTNQISAVLNALKPNVEPATVPDKAAPVRAAYRYMSNRPQQLDYQGAIAKDLPIGSGEIESAHRYVIQQRLKRSGSWWSVENAGSMLSLRVLRANQDWDRYWNPTSVSVA
jgi:hypothetical protein